MKSALLLAVALGFGFAKEPPKEDAVKKEIQKLQGEWVVAHAEKEGKQLSEDERKKLSEFFLTKVIIKDETVQIWISDKGKEPTAGEATPFEVDLSKKPSRMLIKDSVMAIYSLDGDNLKVCLKYSDKFSTKAEDLPTSFDTNMNADWYLFAFKREKKQ
jgi:uncharacterized protein (TIGR03067 family)